MLINLEEFNNNNNNNIIIIIVSYNYNSFSNPRWAESGQFLG